MKVKPVKLCKTHYKLGYASYESLLFIWVFNNSKVLLHDKTLSKPDLLNSKI